MCFQTIIILFVSFILSVAGIETAQTVVVVPATFAQSVSKGKAQIAPIGVIWGNLESYYLLISDIDRISICLLIKEVLVSIFVIKS